ncbi:MAG: penicillin amidase [Paracoccaceae bacterium]|jgi:penicillin amidase
MSLSLIFTWLVRIFAALAALAVVGLALAWTLVAGSLPDYDRDFDLAPGAWPTADVRIVRDAAATPHISGATDGDVFFGLGFAHATDRLWQMELARRAAQGRLAELFGAAALPFDRRMRALDLHRLARAGIKHQTPAMQTALIAYAAGVNARIQAVQDEALGRGAPEFFMFGGALTPWTPADSLSIGKLMAMRLSDQAEAEVRRAALALRLPAARLRDILSDPPSPALIEATEFAALNIPGVDVASRAPTHDPALAWLSALMASSPAPQTHPDDARSAVMPGLFPPVDQAGASNAWALAPERAAAGAPILANDPHMPFSAPTMWYLAHLDFPRPDGPFGVIGATIPGMPVHLMGRNPDLAWGLTAAYIDDADLYIEKIDPADPSRYLTPDGSQPFTTRREVIALPDGKSEEIELRATRHGPVLAPDHFGVGVVTPAGHVAALSWTALWEDDTSLSAALALMMSRSIDDGEAAAVMLTAPGMNVTMADARDVGMVVAGRVPLRSPDSPSQGRLPTPGWIAAGDWQGWIAPAENPRVMRPASGAVANTNNRTTDAPFPRHITHRWGDAYRIVRLDRQLSAREFHTRDSAQALQSDAVSEMARAVLPLIARDMWWAGGAAPSDPAAALRDRALDMLGDWNGEMSAHAPEPLIFAEWMRRLTIRLAEDELGPLISYVEGPQPVFVERVFRNIDDAGIWCDVNKTPKVETCGDIAALALDDALARLSEAYGAAPEGWRWGEAHRGIHRNDVLTRNPIARIVSDIEHQMSGGDFTLLRAQSRGKGETPHAAIHGAGYRMVVDFADPDASMFITATGQSGHPLSRHYDDLSELWQRGDLVRMSLSPGHAAAGALGVSVLRKAPK